MDTDIIEVLGVDMIHFEGSNKLSVEEIERQIGKSIPSDLKDLYERYSEPFDFQRFVVFDAKGSSFAYVGGLIDLDVVYGPTDGSFGIVQSNIQLHQAEDGDILAFASIGGANEVVCNLDDGKVYVWLEEHDCLSDATLVADSIEEFFKMLRFEDPPLLN